MVWVCQLVKGKKFLNECNGIYFRLILLTYTAIYKLNNLSVAYKAVYLTCTMEELDLIALLENICFHDLLISTSKNKHTFRKILYHY